MAKGRESALNFHVVRSIPRSPVERPLRGLSPPGGAIALPMMRSTGWHNPTFGPSRLDAPIDRTSFDSNRLH